MAFRGMHYIIFFALCAAPAGLCQTSIQIRVQQASTVTAVANGGSIVMSAAQVGQPVTATVTISYRGATSLTLSPPELFGPADFSIGGFTAPASMVAGTSATFQIGYVSSNSAGASGQITLAYTEPTVPTTPPVPATSGVITLNLSGVAPEFLVSYSLQTNNNVISVVNGGAIVFPSTPANGSSTAAVTLTNVGSGTGTVQSAVVSGTAFQPQGLPLLPAAVAAGRNLSFSILYTPQQVETSMGNLALMYSGQSINVKLQGVSTASAFTYQVLGSLTPVGADGIMFPDTPVGSTSSVTIQVQNTGNGVGQIGSISATGTGFQLTNSPTLPQTLQPNATLSLVLTFTPTQPGASKGQLRVGSDVLNLSGSGIGPLLIYSYQSGSGTTAIAPTGSVFFSPLPVGNTSGLTFIIQNNGTAPTSISNIGITDANSPYQVRDLPALPLQINPGGSAGFTIVFTPTTVGFASATLKIDAQSFALSGSGTNPPALPAYSFSGPSGAVQPQSQLPIGITLASGYSLPLKGVLTLSAASLTGAADPAVQFATGGGTVSFTIPVNSTQAIFTNGSTQIQFQTGSVASTLTFSATFSTAAGFDLTPQAGLTRQLTIPPSAPQLTSVQISGGSANGFTVVMTGVTSTRSLSTLDFTFTASTNFSLFTSKVSLNVALASGTWFGSSQSQPFGGQFIISVPFTFNSSNTANNTPISAIQSVAVSASSSQGVSNLVSVNVK